LNHQVSRSHRAAVKQPNNPPKPDELHAIRRSRSKHCVRSKPAFASTFPRRSLQITQSSVHESLNRNERSHFLRPPRQSAPTDPFGPAKATAVDVHPESAEQMNCIHHRSAGAFESAVSAWRQRMHSHPTSNSSLAQPASTTSEHFTVHRSISWRNPSY
jgi:hypothetical protein